MLTQEGAREVVELAEENGISFGALIGSHIAFIVVVIGFCVLMLLGV